MHPHQQAMLDRATEPALLLIAPTGGGKTMAGFLPTLAELAEGGHDGLHTLYVSPLKALAADIKRNLRRPVEEMGLPIRIEDRTGDTSASLKKRQRVDPPHILLTTPESLALLTSYEDSPRMFAGLRRVVVDEIHALADSKRGDQLFLALARLQRLCPGLRRVGLSATVEDPQAIARLLARETDLEFIQVSAIFTGVAELKKVFEAAKIRHRNGRGTLLFVDEIHRFNRAQQDALLPPVEEGLITLVGATTREGLREAVQSNFPRFLATAGFVGLNPLAVRAMREVSAFEAEFRAHADGNCPTGACDTKAEVST